METNSLEKLMDDPKFVEALDAAETTADAEKLFAEHGVVVDFEEMKARIAKKNEELSVDDLDAVAGGKISIGRVLRGLTAWKAGKAIGIVARTLIDDAKGKGRAYSTKDINWAMGFIDSGNPFK